MLQRLLHMAICIVATSGALPVGQLDPRGEVHVPIGIANAVDSLKTFVEAEGNFSPGFATYGVYFWVYDRDAGKLVAPTISGVKCERGLAGAGYLIPFSRWSAGEVAVKTEVCQVERGSPAGKIQVVAARVRLTSGGDSAKGLSLFAALRPVGAAGGPIKSLAVSDRGDALLVHGHPALIASQSPSAAGVSEKDDTGDVAKSGKVPTHKRSCSDAGDCSGALRFDLTLAANETKTLGFICPVLPGRRAVGHDWDGTSGWAQLDLAEPNPAEGGVLQPDPGLDYYRGLSVDTVFNEAHAYWRGFVGGTTIRVPDPRWAECFAAIVCHAAMEMNQGAPDVAVVNYNVFNRDGVYVANILQKSGNYDLATTAIDYFLSHPFNGRTRVEADNPGQVLWVMGEHWRFTRDRKWLARVYPSAAKIAAMIRYCRTAPGPHYVKATSLDFGDSLPPDGPDERPAHRRQVLRPGSCDGNHPEYTEAFDVAGVRAAAMLARADGCDEDAAEWDELAEKLMQVYDERFAHRLPAGYGSYSVLWPCRLYPLEGGKAFEQFQKTGATGPGGWRYFALARAHQGLLAGNREAGWKTLANHLAHPQMQGWYACDEGGRSGQGGWRFARTTWKAGVAMPHGWAIAEMWLLLRDCLVYEDGDRIVLLAGVRPEWFTSDKPIVIENLPTHFGRCSLRYTVSDSEATIRVGGKADPPGGFEIRIVGRDAKDRRLALRRGEEVRIALLPQDD